MTATPVLNGPATLCIGSDRYAGTVMYLDEKIVQVREDDYKAAPGHDYYGVQKYEYETNPHGRLFTFRYNERKARYEEIVWNYGTGRWNKYDSGFRVHFAYKESYRDPSF